MSSEIDSEIDHLLRARMDFKEKIMEIDRRLRQISKAHERVIPIER